MRARASVHHQLALIWLDLSFDPLATALINEEHQDSRGQSRMNREPSAELETARQAYHAQRASDACSPAAAEAYLEQLALGLAASSSVKRVQALQ